jgi:hypothetical protein
VTVKTGPADGREMDTPVALRFDREKVHVFEATTGVRRP